MNCNPVTLLSKKERARIANHSFNTILQAVAMQPAALVKRNFSYAAFFASVLNICFFELLCVGTSERVLYQTLGKHLMIRNRRLLIIYRIHCTENHIFFFPDVLKRRSFQKDCAGIWSFLYYREIWYFFLPKRWSYLQMENERWSFSKKYTEIWFFECSEKMDFSKRPRRDMIFLVLSGKLVFLPASMAFFPWTENERGMTFLKKYTETWYFLFDMFHTPSATHTKIKIKDNPISQKYTKRWLTSQIDTLEKAPRILCTFMETFTGVFIYCSSAKKINK